MESIEKTVISVQTKIDAPIDIVWKCWTSPEDIVKWNNASEDWHTPKAENDLRVGGNFTFRMEAKDGSSGFDFGGIYNEVEKNKLIEYTIGDGRKVEIAFNRTNNKTEVVETFEAENVNPVDMQRNGWQSILDNFKKYTESNYYQ